MINLYLYSMSYEETKNYVNCASPICMALVLQYHMTKDSSLWDSAMNTLHVWQSNIVVICMFKNIYKTCKLKEWDFSCDYTVSTNKAINETT